MADGSISQQELDNLFGNLEELPSAPQHVWLVKPEDGRGVFGGRCFSLWEAQSLEAKVHKDYPGIRTIIKQVK